MNGDSNNPKDGRSYAVTKALDRLGMFENKIFHGNIAHNHACFNATHKVDVNSMNTFLTTTITGAIYQTFDISQYPALKAGLFQHK